MKNIKIKSSVDAAYQILKKKKRAMTSREIMEMAFKEFDLSMKGKTPDPPNFFTNKINSINPITLPWSNFRT